MPTATNSWEDLSTLCFGLIVTKHEPVTGYDPSIFFPPYSEGFKIWKKYGDVTRVVETIGDAAYEAAILAASMLEVTGDEVKQNSRLTQAARRYQAGEAAEKIGRAFKTGKSVEDAKVLELSVLFRNLATPTSVGLKSVDEVDISDYNPYITVGWPNLDKFFGGLARSRPNLVGALPGFGKTTWTQRLVGCVLEHDENALPAVYSLELSAENWKDRMKKTFPSSLKHAKRMLISDRHVDIIDIALEAAAVGATHVVIDSWRYVVPHATPESYDDASIRLNEMCRELQIPVVVLAQFNAQRYTTKLHDDSHFAYGRTLVDVSGNVFTLGRFKNEEDLNEQFVFDENRPDAIMCWKQGDGWQNQRKTKGAVFMDSDEPWPLDGGRWQYYGDGAERKPFKRKDN